MALTKVSSDMINPDPTDASNLSSGDVPLAQLGNVPASDTSAIEDDIALLGFKVASNGAMSKYNLVDQTEDAFVDQTGIDAADSTDAIWNSAKYFSGGTPAPTGGVITTYTDSGTDYIAHSFLDDGVFAVQSGTISVDYFMVAGGGGGGNAGNGGGAWGGGGGGGAGGFLTGTGVSFTVQSYNITAGDGGAGAGYQAADNNGATGENSVIAPVTSGTTYTALGGGGGASGIGSSTGNNGGSGGGGAYSNRASGTGTAGPPRQGYDGGTNTYVDSAAAGGGGGAQGGAADAGGAMGGTGVSNYYKTGVAGTTKGTHYFAGGGSGGSYSGTAGLINAYGGGAGGIKGGTDNGTSNGSAAVANTGGGGGGGSASVSNTQFTGGAGGAGGKGIVVLRFEDTGYSADDMTLVSEFTEAEAAPTKGDLVMTYTTAGGGSTTVGTDLTAEVSADDGSTWTDLGLVAGDIQGTTGGHTIISKHDVTISSTITAPYKMRYRIKTLNQAATKETRIQAVSLGWS